MAKSVLDMSEDEFADWLCALPPPPGPPSTKAEFAASIARARADVEAGRVYPHAIVGEWMKTLDESGCKPFEEWLAGRNE